jgi:RAMP superfamily
MSAGYDFVPLPPDVARRKRSEAQWDRRAEGTLSGLLRVTFRAEQAVHVGSGHKRLHENKVLRAGVRIQGQPGIPGASLKGALRSRFEAITRSCLQHKPSSNKPATIRSRTGVRKAQLARSAVDRPFFQGMCREDSLCPACALFGRMSLRSRVTARDLSCAPGVTFQVAPIHEQFGPNLHHVGQAVRRSGAEPRGTRPAENRPRPAETSSGAYSDRGAGNEYFEVHSLHGRKFALGMGPINDKQPQWLEVIPAGSLITGAIALWNVLPGELGGLLAALGRTPASTLKLGAGKGRGFGRLVLTDLAGTLHDHTGALVPLDRQAESDWRAKFVQPPDYWPDGEAALVRIHQGDC